MLSDKDCSTFLFGFGFDLVLFKAVSCISERKKTNNHRFRHKNIQCDHKKKTLQNNMLTLVHDPLIHQRKSLSYFQLLECMSDQESETDMLELACNRSVFLFC